MVEAVLGAAPPPVVPEALVEEEGAAPLEAPEVSAVEAVAVTTEMAEVPEVLAAVAVLVGLTPARRWG
jgi:hypothetical protein